MRIVQVSTLYPPELLSGGTLACHQLASSLVRRSHQVLVFAGSARIDCPPLAERHFTYQGIPIETLNVAPWYVPCLENYRNPAVALRFARYLERVSPDVVHFHSIQALGADLIAAAKERGSGVVVTLHDSWFWCAQQFLTTPAPQLRMCPLRVDTSTCDCVPGFDFGIRHRYLAAALARADRVLAVSEFQARVALENGVGANLVTCENGLPLAAPSRRSHSRKVRFAYLGGGHPWKGAGTLAAALPRLRGDLTLSLHGMEATAWRAAGGDLADRRVRCRPPFGPGELSRVLSRADLVRVTALCVESYSLVTREALQHGIPVIASRSGGPESVVRDGENGLLFPRGDVGALAAAMQRLMDDRGLLSRASAVAAATPVRGLAEQVDELEAIYREVRPARAQQAHSTDDHPRPALASRAFQRLQDVAIDAAQRGAPWLRSTLLYRAARRIYSTLRRRVI